MSLGAHALRLVEQVSNHQLRADGGINGNHTSSHPLKASQHWYFHCNTYHLDTYQNWGMGMGKVFNSACIKCCRPASKQTWSSHKPLLVELLVAPSHLEGRLLTSIVSITILTLPKLNCHITIKMKTYSITIKFYSFILNCSSYWEISLTMNILKI